MAGPVSAFVLAPLRLREKLARPVEAIHLAGTLTWGAHLGFYTPLVYVVKKPKWRSGAQDPDPMGMNHPPVRG